MIGKLLVSSMLLFLVSIQSINCKYVIKGKVLFEGKPPQDFPLGSRLIVKVEDTSLMDAPSKVLNKTERTIKKGDDLTYSIIIDDAALPNGIQGVPDVSVSLIFSLLNNSLSVI